MVLDFVNGCECECLGRDVAIYSACDVSHDSDLTMQFFNLIIN